MLLKLFHKTEIKGKFLKSIHKAHVVLIPNQEKKKYNRQVWTNIHSEHKCENC